MEELTPRTSKFWPYRILTILLYSSPKGVQRYGSLVLINLTEMGKHQGVPRKRLRDYLIELERLSLVTDIKIDNGTAQFKLVTPIGYKLKEN